MKKLTFLFCFFFLFSNMIIAGATPPNQPVKTSSEAVPLCPNYAEESSWVVRTQSIDKPVDVFYVYPTIYPEPSPKNMDIGRKDLQAKAKHLMVAQAGVFANLANLFAPYYRQASFTVLNPKEDMFQNRYFRIGADDIARAFEYCLANINPDRPFIIAGHSQGSLVLLDLLRSRCCIFMRSCGHGRLCIVGEGSEKRFFSSWNLIYTSKGHK